MEQKKTFRKYHGSNLGTIENIHEKSLVAAATLLTASQNKSYFANEGDTLLMKDGPGEFLLARRYTKVPKTSQIAFDTQGQAIMATVTGCSMPYI